MSEKTVFVSADHGLAVFYFLQSDVVKTMLQAGVRVVVLTEDNSREVIQRRFGQPGMIVEGLRVDRLLAYQREKDSSTQWWLDFLRRAGSAGNTNLAVVDSYIQQVKSEARGRRRQLFPVMEGAARLMRRARPRAQRPGTLPGALQSRCLCRPV